ncbi:MAG: phage tail protein [Pseudoalteromonas sp.]|uniref:gpW family head-tail joining protein n=1 Tax=Pseudoalteromonas sp. TaxID=53249 RepID=UPI001D373BFD|nr:gpW family head-tail joining protein [Pseudoalteromonas sp.]NRA78325.1 phage tail protein [Pseudoalteromonas sp.]
MNIQEKLDEARSAYHSLMTGTATVSITKNNRQVQFNQANKFDLKNYITELEIELNGISKSKRRGPMGVCL